jgi:uncharacterized membrane protein YkvA (DUF1232 family)
MSSMIGFLDDIIVKSCMLGRINFLHVSNGTSVVQLSLNEYHGVPL